MSSSEKSRGRRLFGAVVWLAIVLQCLGLGLAGFAKFGSPDAWRVLFEEWGYPGGFAFVIGGLEMLGAVLLLVRPLSAWAALGLMAIMLGAVVTVMVNPGDMGPTAAAVNFALLGLIVVGRWKQRGLRRSPASVPGT